MLSAQEAWPFFLTPLQLSVKKKNNNCCVSPQDNPASHLPPISASTVQNLFFLNPLYCQEVCSHAHRYFIFFLQIVLFIKCGSAFRPNAKQILRALKTELLDNSFWKTLLYSLHVYRKPFLFDCPFSSTSSFVCRVCLYDFIS